MPYRLFDPDTAEEYEVPDAATARFWMERGMILVDHEHGWPQIHSVYFQERKPEVRPKNGRYWLVFLAVFGLLVCTVATFGWIAGEWMRRGN